MNPETSQLVKVHALYDSDSDSNVSLVSKSASRKAGHHGNPTRLVMNVAGDETVITQQQVSFCMVSLNHKYQFQFQMSQLLLNVSVNHSYQF